MEKTIENIAVLMKKHNVSAYLLAKNTGVSEAGIGNILNGKVKRPHKTTLDSLLKYLSKLDSPTPSNGGGSVINSGISHVSGSGNVSINNGGGGTDGHLWMGGAKDGCMERLAEIRKQLAALERQLAEKDSQISEKDRQISKLLEQQARLIGKLTD